MAKPKVFICPKCNSEDSGEEELSELNTIKASVALWVNAADVKLDEFIASLEGANLENLDFTLLSQAQKDLDRARRIFKLEDVKDADQKR